MNSSSKSTDQDLSNTVLPALPPPAPLHGILKNKPRPPPNVGIMPHGDTPVRTLDMDSPSSRSNVASAVPRSGGVAEIVPNRRYSSDTFTDTTKCSSVKRLSLSSVFDQSHKEAVHFEPETVSKCPSFTATGFKLATTNSLLSSSDSTMCVASTAAISAVPEKTRVCSKSSNSQNVVGEGKEDRLTYIEEKTISAGGKTFRGVCASVSSSVPAGAVFKRKKPIDGNVASTNSRKDKVITDIQPSADSDVLLGSKKSKENVVKKKSPSGKSTSGDAEVATSNRSHGGNKADKSSKRKSDRGYPHLFSDNLTKVGSTSGKLTSKHASNTTTEAKSSEKVKETVSRNEHNSSKTADSAGSKRSISSEKSNLKRKRKSRMSSGDSLSNTSSDASDDTYSSDDSDVNRRSRQGLKNEWKKILEASIDASEPAGLSMYDRVKRRSSATYKEPWKDSTATDKFSVLRQKRVAKQQNQAKKRRIHVSENGDDADSEDCSDRKKIASKPRKKKLSFADVYSSEKSDGSDAEDEREARRSKKARRTVDRASNAESAMLKLKSPSSSGEDRDNAVSEDNYRKSHSSASVTTAVSSDECRKKSSRSKKSSVLMVEDSMLVESVIPSVAQPMIVPENSEGMDEHSEAEETNNSSSHQSMLSENACIPETTESKNENTAVFYANCNNRIPEEHLVPDSTVTNFLMDEAMTPIKLDSVEDMAKKEGTDIATAKCETRERDLVMPTAEDQNNENEIKVIVYSPEVRSDVLETVDECCHRSEVDEAADRVIEMYVREEEVVSGDDYQNGDGCCIAQLENQDKPIAMAPNDHTPDISVNDSTTAPQSTDGHSVEAAEEQNAADLAETEAATAALDLHTYESSFDDKMDDIGLAVPGYSEQNYNADEVADQKLDAESHVDEVIDHVIHGYVEIMPEELLILSAQQMLDRSIQTSSSLTNISAEVSVPEGITAGSEYASELCNVVVASPTSISTQTESPALLSTSCSTSTFTPNISVASTLQCVVDASVVIPACSEEPSLSSSQPLSEKIADDPPSTAKDAAVLSGLTVAPVAAVLPSPPLSPPRASELEAGIASLRLSANASETVRFQALNSSAVGTSERTGVFYTAEYGANEATTAVTATGSTMKPFPGNVTGLVDAPPNIYPSAEVNSPQIAVQMNSAPKVIVPNSMTSGQFVNCVRSPLQPYLGRFDAGLRQLPSSSCALSHLCTPNRMSPPQQLAALMELQNKQSTWNPPSSANLFHPSLQQVHLANQRSSVQQFSPATAVAAATERFSMLSGSITDVPVAALGDLRYRESLPSSHAQQRQLQMNIGAVLAAARATPPQPSPRMEELHTAAHPLLERHPVVWQGLLYLKNDRAFVQMHYVSGSKNLVPVSLPPVIGCQLPHLRIAQRMRLEPQQLEGVARRMSLVNEHCVLVALPCGPDRKEILIQSEIMNHYFISYLQQKQAAGIVNVLGPESNQVSVHFVFLLCYAAMTNNCHCIICSFLIIALYHIAHFPIVRQFR